MFTLHFDVEFSSVSMASRPPTIGKTAMFLIVVPWSWRYNAEAWELSANHTLQSMTTTRWWRHWQADGLLSCLFNGGRIGKKIATLKGKLSVRLQRWNYWYYEEKDEHVY